tara:strand:+ start:108 stop:323 length:216 start_codon:yes stop_codon:yes gene_type:complete
MTPFEQSAEFVHSLAEGLCFSYALLNYLPVLEDLERQRCSAVSAGDSQLEASIIHIQTMLNQQVSNIALEA